MKLTGESKFFIGIILATIALVGVSLFSFAKPAQTPIIRDQNLIPATSYMKGNKDAKVMLVEFSDFQCPACKAAKPIVDELIKTYPDKMLFVYRHFPLDQHPYGMKAAHAAEAAGAQGKFWEMYDMLFANQEKFSDELFSKLATELKLDMNAFTLTATDSAISESIRKDRAYGLTIGVNSTPTFFLNGQKLELSTFQELKTRIEKAVQ